MNIVMKNQIISELDSLPDQKGPSLLDYLHFLKKDSIDYTPNQETIDAINQADRDRKNMKSFSSVDDMFKDMGIEE
ncbi:MAG: hypothetical protein PF447_06760 [Spirochaetaceae bacterium]|jgi:hypothetical protein|nr:hypothetical protein [Spirochaetaceae bacterium]